VGGSEQRALRVASRRVGRQIPSGYVQVPSSNRAHAALINAVVAAAAHSPGYSVRFVDPDSHGCC
jgi:hypothetical protein